MWVMISPLGEDMTLGRSRLDDNVSTYPAMEMRSVGGARRDAATGSGRTSTWQLIEDEQTKMVWLAT
jgi:hypothetical protein